MTNFDYAAPQTEAEAIEMLGEGGASTAVLAGGTDLVSLLQQNVLQPARVVDITAVPTLRGVEPIADGVAIGALTTLEEIQDSPLLAEYPSLNDVVDGVRAIQLQQNGTLGGDLCHLPNCWYFRKGYGLLATENGQSLAEAGDNRYHAVFGNRGPAKFVSASRFAPALIAWGAKVRIIGPRPNDEQWLPLEQFYAAPRTAEEGVTVLRPGQLLAHIWLPASAAGLSATYEVLELEGLDWPLAACAATLYQEGGLVRRARIVLGHVAPTPWVSAPAASALIGQPVSVAAAERAADAAIAEATPLWNNEYKVQLARTSVKRAILKAAGQWKEGV